MRSTIIRDFSRFFFLRFFFDVVDRKTMEQFRANSCYSTLCILHFQSNHSRFFFFLFAFFFFAFFDILLQKTTTHPMGSVLKNATLERLLVSNTYGNNDLLR